MGRLFRPALAVLLVAAMANGVCVQALKPASPAAYLFWAVWLIAPLAIGAAVLIFAKRANRSAAHWELTAILTTVAGLLYLADVIFLRPDAQGAAAVLLTPLLQAGLAMLLLPLLGWALRKR